MRIDGISRELVGIFRRLEVRKPSGKTMPISELEAVLKVMENPGLKRRKRPVNRRYSLKSASSYYPEINTIRALWISMHNA